MKHPSVFLLAALLPITTQAQMRADSPPVTALVEGHVSAALPPSNIAAMVASEIQRRTSSGGEITVEFFRIVRFQSQPHCGRVAYALFQQSSQSYWPQLGGQINVCDNGSPPLRICPGSPVLVGASTRCLDGSMPVDTDEIKSAIASGTNARAIASAPTRPPSFAQPTKGSGR